MRGLVVTLIVPLTVGFVPQDARSPCRRLDLSRYAGEASDYEADILSKYGSAPKPFVKAPAEFFTSYRWVPPTEEVARFVAPGKPWMNQVTQQNSDGGGGLEASEFGSIATSPVFGAITLALALGAFYNNFVYQSGSG